VRTPFGKRGAVTWRDGLTSQLRWLGVILMLSLALAAILLFWSTYRQDEIATENARHLARTAMKLQFNTLQKIATDYAWWDDAYVNLVENFNPDWFDETFADGEYLRDAFGITGSAVVDADNKIRRYMYDSKIVEDAPRLDWAANLDRGAKTLFENARQLVDGEFIAVTGFIHLDDQAYFAAAHVIYPSFEERIERAAVTPANASVVAVMQPLAGPLLQTLAKDFGLLELRFVPGDDPTGGLPLRDVDGNRFGALSWQLDRPSHFVLRVVLPGFLLLAVCIGLLGWHVINGLRRGQGQLLNAMQQAQLADRSKTEFLANMSHELRTPLNAILGFSEMMKDEVFGPLGDRHYSEYSAHIHSSGGHLLDIISDVLELSKIEAGKFALQETEIALPDTVAAVARLIEPRANEKGITLNVDVAPDLPAIYADDRAIKQILLNLLSNAVKFSSMAGVVDLYVARTEAGAVEISVSDTGCGIAEDQLPLVMQPFHQVDSPDTRSEGGTGLGLPLSASLVALHGGDMRIVSEVGKGTTVTVILPKNRVPGATAG
jgi:signal transduction histidine kinase